ncbi:MAG: hypothetical protein IKN27_06485 [Selenomonadaceae bacterium]|nr:hypothetical protein [Selenomonadaceae bacterium]
MDTKKITVMPVDAKTFANRQDIKLRRVISAACEKHAESFAPLFEAFNQTFAAKEWVKLSRAGQSEGVYYVHDIAGLFPDLDVHGCNYAYAYRPITYNDSNILNPSRLMFAGFQGVIPTEAEAKKLFNDNISYFRASNGNIKVRGSEQCGLTVDNGNSYMWTRNDYKYNVYNYNGSQSYYFWVIPIYRFGMTNPSPQKVLWTWLEFDLTPKNFKDNTAKILFNALKNFYALGYLKLKGEQIILDEKKFFDAVKSGTKFDLIDTKFLNEKTIDGREFEIALRDELLTCDNRRAGLSRYDEKILVDPNRGHWDLWDMPEAGEQGLKLSEPIYARDPAADVNSAGIVGIDFGTKSTVVVYENERGEIIPLQFGNGDYSKGVKASNYENPTIIEFRHIENFLAAYRDRDGRPKTSWDDVTVSHTAQENLRNTTDSSLFASFFENIKQWCGNIQYTTKIRDHDGTEEDLPPFIDITKDEFNPLEFYAYYLGAYINHMLNPKHIFTKYILSFPVTYERNIRERMLKSFRAGILKSLPTALLANEDAMKNFQVVEGTSEPAAYAVTALEGYGCLNGEETDDVYYSVFDFGGGTTDFDFGVLKLADGDDADYYDYVLTHFGAHGDRTLGGENLLRLLAFHVFKANSEKLLKPREENPHVKIPFTWAADKLEFAGAEGLIRSSQEANLNMHNLMETLRPIWEAPDSDAAKKILNSGEVSPTLFDDTGKDITNLPLKIGAQKFFDDVADVQSPPKVEPTAENSVEISTRKFTKIVNEAWSGGGQPAFKQLEAWAAAGHADSLRELKDLSVAGYEQATDILKKFADDKSAAPTDLPNVSPKKSSPPTAPTVDLRKILSDRISQGIDSFFLSLRDAFDKVSGGSDNGVATLSEVKEIAIFLAGNSTKAALVKKLFEEYTDAETGKARELLGFGKTQEMPRFKIYPPLGTADADEIQKTRGVEVDTKNFERPTGKTGVAFGLLRCRDGSTIRVVDISSEGVDKKQVPFRFYLGRRQHGKFKIVIDKATKLGTWKKFIGAKLGVFDLLYTDSAIAATNNAPDSVAKRLTIRFDADPEADVYIRPVESNKICYAVSKGEPPVEMEGTVLTLE